VLDVVLFLGSLSFDSSDSLSFFKFLLSLSLIFTLSLSLLVSILFSLSLISFWIFPSSLYICAVTFLILLILLSYIFSLLLSLIVSIFPLFLVIPSISVKVLRWVRFISFSSAANCPLRLRSLRSSSWSTSNFCSSSISILTLSSCCLALFN